MKELITEAVKELDENKVYKLIENALEVGMADTEILDCMRLGMDEVGKLFANGDYYVADLIMAGYIFKTVLEMIGIYKKQVSDNQAKGRIIICTPFGDFHDIGKDIFSGMMIAEDYKVFDLGVNVTQSELMSAVKAYKPDILAFSVTMFNAVQTVKKMMSDLLREGLRKDIKVILGGAVADQDLSHVCDIDYCTNDIAEGMMICSEWMEEKNGTK